MCTSWSHYKSSHKRIRPATEWDRYSVGVKNFHPPSFKVADHHKNRAHLIQSSSLEKKLQLSVCWLQKAFRFKLLKIFSTRFAWSRSLEFVSEKVQQDLIMKVIIVVLYNLFTLFISCGSPYSLICNKYLELKQVITSNSQCMLLIRLIFFC